MKNLVYPVRYFVNGLLVFSLVVVVSACSEKPVTSEPGQSLVRVNDEEITITQLNDELVHAKVKAEQLEQAKKQLLESMIDLQLMVAESQQNKLDRSPVIMRAIERAKKQIIAQSYIQTLLSRIENPTDDEIAQYYEKHPELFAQRKKYTLAFLRFPSKAMNDDLHKVIDSAKSLSDAVQWLDKRQISYIRDETIKTTMELSPQMNAKLKDSKKGEIVLIEDNATNLLFAVKDVEADPVTVETIKPQISAYLMNIKRREAVQSEVSRLRSAANIEYLHATAGTDSNVAKAVEPQTISPPLNAQQDGASLENMLLKDDSIERGISGLK